MTLGAWIMLIGGFVVTLGGAAACLAVAIKKGRAD
ncbi:MAG: MetS family NSS transporter small subunit [Desulfarculaceae bacterium]|nr:MetS family NSS transporter small subunit [Desulfarculaceae bacterium]MCF8047475.1 MetS family NSS transporter small subunit [Desulfarculaceae bacterium]MCF8063974.1 MetS family NSS transporter small subunit [Desulfarculaceae bacterium]MCF8097013.1 MetS family NSS transporter small subunit [Desulfarculaceae bacterium]MCF8122065.1 MetS family NSS transporter small subunit [Desulfarculaceae bacterium]